MIRKWQSMSQPLLVCPFRLCFNAPVWKSCRGESTSSRPTHTFQPNSQVSFGLAVLVRMLEKSQSQKDMWLNSCIKMQLMSAFKWGMARPETQHGKILSSSELFRKGTAQRGRLPTPGETPGMCGAKLSLHATHPDAEAFVVTGCCDSARIWLQRSCVQTAPWGNRGGQGLGG